MANILIRQRGEFAPFSFDLDGASLSGWICTISVVRFIGDVSIITPRIIKSNGKAFAGFLTHTEVIGLSLGLHFVVANIVKSSSDEKVQKFMRFNVAQEWFTQPVQTLQVVGVELITGGTDKILITGTTDRISVTAFV